MNSVIAYVFVLSCAAASSNCPPGFVKGDKMEVDVLGDKDVFTIKRNGKLILNIPMSSLDNITQKQLESIRHDLHEARK